MDERKRTRRNFLQVAGKVTAAAGLGFSAGILPGCGAEEPDGAVSGEGSPARGSATGGGTDPGRDPCGDLTGLSPGDIQDREDAGYVAVTPDPAKRCDNCELWEAPEAGAPCGGCTLFAGPIHPGGYCDLWVQV